jgi:hypothetical protein
MPTHSGSPCDHVHNAARNDDEPLDRLPLNVAGVVSVSCAPTSSGTNPTACPNPSRIGRPARIPLPVHRLPALPLRPGSDPCSRSTPSPTRSAGTATNSTRNSPKNCSPSRAGEMTEATYAASVDIVPIRRAATATAARFSRRHPVRIDRKRAVRGYSSTSDRKRVPDIIMLRICRRRAAKAPCTALAVAGIGMPDRGPSVYPDPGVRRPSRCRVVVGQSL